jgi:isocitrate dehydrogenase kinase/phosphatase
MQADSVERLSLYHEVVYATIDELESLLGDRLHGVKLWQATRRGYSRRIAGDRSAELAETFYNSVNRRIFGTKGVNPQIEYTSLDHRLPPGPPVFQRFYGEGDSGQLIARVLAAYAFNTPYRNLEQEAALAAEAVDRYLGAELGGRPIDFVETLRPIFFRNKGAYVVGRLKSGGKTLPFVLPLLNGEEGVTLDAVLLEEDEVSIVFSFTRSYFLVDTDSPRDLIAFLETILPQKPVEELYISLGFNQHGKRVTYLRLQHHLATTDDRFVIAEGDRGMVMLAFSLANYHVLFKVIRDRFDHPKSSTRREVKERYRLVFQHDRVGRLVDAQEFEELEFRRDQFSPELLAEMKAEASHAVTVNGESVVLREDYTERKLVPLNLYLRSVSGEAARHAVLDYGASIKQLAAANIFPGDFLLKNFGVTRHGRVVFYDYDELCLVTDCRFRRLPPPRDELEAMAAEPWFGVGEHDIFPEEFVRFLGLTGELRQLFERHHGDLLTVQRWREYQRRLEEGEIMDVFPYSQARRLRHGARGG